MRKSRDNRSRYKQIECMMCARKYKMPQRFSVFTVLLSDAMSMVRFRTALAFCVSEFHAVHTMCWICHAAIQIDRIRSCLNFSYGFEGRLRLQKIDFEFNISPSPSHSPDSMPISPCDVQIYSTFLTSLLWMSACLIFTTWLGREQFALKSQVVDGWYQVLITHNARPELHKMTKSV